MYDLAVIGGGPGGTAAAITAARYGANVLLLEKGSFPRHKVCGEFVSAESLKLLTSLLPPSPELLASAPRLHRARIFIDDRMLEMPIDPCAVSIPRFELDQALWTSAQHNGIRAVDRQLVSAIKGDGPFTVRTGGHEYQARAVVDASGRWSNLTRNGVANGNGSSGKWLGLKAHFSEAAPCDSVDLYFFNGGYCGVQPVASTEPAVNACAMVRSDVGTSLADTLQCHPELARRSAAWQQLTDTVATSPLLFTTPQPVRDGILRAGDAAGFVDPFVGDGISLALQGGALAATALGSFLKGDISLQRAAENYAQSYRRELTPVFTASSTIRRFLGLPAPIRNVMLVALASFPALTRYLVRKTRTR